MPHNSAQISGISYEKLLKYSFSLLAKKRYTGLEITKKLQQYIQRRYVGNSEKVPEFPMENPELVEAVTDRLKELKYIDDPQYAKDYLEHRVKYKPRGKFLLTRELTHKGIDKAVINDIWERSGVNEADMAIEALRKRQKFWSGISGQKEASKLRERAYRFLASKGFKPDAIYKAVEACYNPSAE